MADPNSCATCKYRRPDTGSAWCYMFHEQPEPLCMQHQDRKPKRIAIISGTGLGAAVAVILAQEAQRTAAGVQGTSNDQGEKP